MNQLAFPHIRATKLFFFLLLLCVYPWLRAHPQDEFVRVVGSGEIAASPGQIVTISFQVENRTPRQQSYVPDVQVPEGWRLILRPQRFTLSAREMQSYLVSLVVPAHATAGDFLVRIIVRDDAAPPRISSAFARITVLASKSLALSVIEAPKYVVAGEEFKTLIAATNGGNEGGWVHLKATSNMGYRVLLDSSSFWLGAGQTWSFPVTVVTRDDQNEKARHILHVRARFESDSVETPITHVLEIIPRSVEVGEQYHQFPVQLSVRATGEEDRFKPQGEIVGRGKLTETGDGVLDVVLRGPNTQTISALGRLDEYRIAYTSPSFRATLGDQNFRLSPLTELGRYAFGASGQGAIGGLSAGAYAFETRLTTPRQQQAAGFLKYSAQRWADVGVHYVAKRETDSIRADIASARGVLRPFWDMEFDFEYAGSRTDSVEDRALGARISGRQPWILYDFRYIKAGPQYQGYYRDLDYKSASTTFYLFQDFRLEGLYRLETRNTDLDTAKTFAPREEFYQAGIGFSNYISVSYRTTERKDLMSDSTFNSVENMIQFRLGYAFTNFSLYANADIGEFKDQILGKAGPFSRYSMYATYRPSAAQTYSGTIEYYTERDLFTDVDQSRLSGSLSAFMFLGSRSQLQFNGYLTRQLTQFKTTSAFLEAAFEHIFTFGHKVILRGRKSYNSLSTADDPFAYSLEYAIPLAIPLARRRSTGQLRGVIIDQETSRGVQDALVNAGASTAITDDDGEFLFPALRPDRYYLTVDKSTIGLAKVTMEPMPFETVVRGGEETEIKFSITRSARVIGKISLFEFKEESFADTVRRETQLVGGFRNAIIELTSGTETLRRVSDGRGIFTFADVRPGRWRLRILKDNLPPNTYLDRDEAIVVLNPADTASFEFNLRPRIRTIRILEQRDLVAQQTVTPLEVKQKPPAVPQDIQYACLIFPHRDGDGYILQISSWKTRGKASSVATLAEQRTGYKSTVQKAYVKYLGTRYRVQLEKFRTREEAERVCMDLYRIEPELTEWKRPSEGEDIMSGLCLIFPDPDGYGYILQISSWRTRTKAIRVGVAAEQLTKLRASIERASVPGLGIRYRVRLLNLPSIEAAEAVCAQLQPMLWGPDLR